MLLSSTFVGGKEIGKSDKHRDIFPLSIPGKVLDRVLLNRLLEHLENDGLLPESRCSFRKGRRTVDIDSDSLEKSAVNRT